MRSKMHRLRGSKTYGRGWRKHKSGSRGGVGNSSLWDCKNTTRILEAKIDRRKVVNILVLQAQLHRLARKGLVRTTSQQVKFLCHKFCTRYRKILSQGQPSKKYIFCPHVRLSKTCALKIQD